MKRLFIGIAALCCLATYAATVHNIDNFRNADGTPLVVPQPQKYEAKSGVFKLPETLTVEAPASEKIIFEYLGQELKRFSRQVAPGDKSAICRFVLTGDGVPENKEGYTLEITSDGVTVKARTTDGLFYGAVTLCNLLRNAEKPELECCNITDWPTMPYRCYTLRISNVPPKKLGQLKRLIDAMARFKFNSVFLEVSEAFPYEKEQFVNAKYHHTREGMTEFRDYCRARHVKIVPSTQVLSHNAWLATHADWDKMKEATPNIPWNAQPCIQNEEARRITLNCLREQIEFFDPELFYIYTDEIFLGPFRKCPRCKNVPAMTLLADYMKFLREGLKDYKGRLIFSNDCYYSGRTPKWPWGDEFRGLLDPKRDIIGYWGYGNRLKEEGIAPFKSFVTMGTCITGKPLNTCNMTKMILKYKGEGVRLTHWYFSLGGSFTSFKSETPESTGGFPHGSEYVWNFRDVYYGDLTYDGVYEMLRSLRPEMVDDATAREEARVLPLDRAVNAELSKSGMFPELDDARLAELKAILAKRPEHFELLTAPGGRYYGMRVSGDKKDNGRKGIQFNTGNVKFKTLTLLMTASRPYNLVDYLSFVVYGKKRFDTPTAAMLTLTYADGKKRQIPLRYRADFTDWNQIQGGVNMRFAVRGVDLKNRYYSFGVCDLANPRPEVPVKSINFSAKMYDGISPVILAASLKGADKKFKLRDFDPAKMIVKPFPDFKPNVPVNTEYSFADGKIPEGVRIDVLGKLAGKATTSVVDDPERGKVLKITVPPASQNHADGYVRVNISVPFKYDGKARGTFANVRLVAEPKDFARCMEYFHTRKITDALNVEGKFRSYSRRVSPNGKWVVLTGRFDSKASEKTLKDLSGANTRRLCFFFNQITKPVELFIGDLGSCEEIYDIVPEWGPDQERD